MLLGAYVRRKRFEAKLLAVELSKVMGGRASTGAEAAGNGRIHADDMLSMMGLTL